MRTIRVAAVSAALLVPSTLPVAAVDGVIEINQAKALAGGVTPSDTSGYPVTIALSGSYRLTSDLDVTFLGLPASANTTAISVLNVISATIDLNGFMIRGPASCNGLTCINTGTGVGIQATSANVAVRNGVISGMGSNGIDIVLGHVEDVLVAGNGGHGVSLAEGTVSRVRSRFNGGSGISGSHLTVTDSQSGSNISHGIYIQSGTIDGCYAIQNAGTGIAMLGGLVSNSNLFVNTGPGKQLSCTGSCGLSGNLFNAVGCFDSATCLSCTGACTHIPAGSNVCGVSPCL